jgi:CheY-like chemotaxis protein
LSRFPVVQQQRQFVPLSLVSQTEQESQEQYLFRGRILLVDDDDDLRRLLRALLEGDGYQVFSCRDASRALKVFASRGDIDLLLTDFQMPQMSGVELCRRIAELQPDLPMLILSGAILPEDARVTIAANGWELIAKPCDVLVLLQTIASRLEAKRAANAVDKTEACVP